MKYYTKVNIRYTQQLEKISDEVFSFTSGIWLQATYKWNGKQSSQKKKFNKRGSLNVKQPIVFLFQSLTDRS